MYFNIPKRGSTSKQESRCKRGNSALEGSHLYVFLAHDRFPSFAPNLHVVHIFFLLELQYTCVDNIGHAVGCDGDEYGGLRRAGSHKLITIVALVYHTGITPRCCNAWARLGTSLPTESSCCISFGGT